MLSLVWASSLPHVTLLCLNRFWVFSSPDPVLGHREGPQGGMPEQQRCQRASPIPACPEGSTRLPPAGTAVALPRQSIHGGEEKETLPSALPIALGRAPSRRRDCLTPGKEAMHFNASLSKSTHVRWDWWERCNVEAEGKKKPKPSGTGEFPWRIFVAHTETPWRNIYWFSPRYKLSSSCTLNQ